MFFHDEFLKITDALENHRVQYVVIGGFAVVIHGFPRFTEDIDIFIKNTPENVEKLQTALLSVYPDDLCIKDISTNDLSNYSVIRYGTPDLFVIDIIDKIGEMFSFDDLITEIVSYNEHTIKIANVETLIKMKKDTIRLKDKQDVFFLLEKQKEITDANSKV